MVDAPEKIWIEHDGFPYFYEESELDEVGSHMTEYVRADLYAALEAQLAEALKVETCSPRWEAVEEKGNDNFSTSIYEAGYKGLLVARCNQNGEYPWQATAIIRGLEQNKAAALEATPSAPKVTDEMVQAAWVRASEMSAGTTMANKSALREVLKAALNVAGFRIVGPGEVDLETVERCAEVVEEDNRTPLAKQSGHIPVWLKYARDRAAALRAMGEEQS